MNRRGFLAGLGVAVFAPKFGRWFTQKPLIVPATFADVGAVPIAALENLDETMRKIFTDPIMDNWMDDSKLLRLFGDPSPIKVGGRYIETASYFTLPPGVGTRRYWL